MQTIKEDAYMLKACNTDRDELVALFCRLSLVDGPSRALRRLYEYFRLRWTKAHLKSWKKHFKLIVENQDNEEWLVKTHGCTPTETRYIEWIQRNFLHICEQIDIPAQSILLEAKEQPFIAEHILKEHK